MSNQVLNPYSPSLPRPVSQVIEEHHFAQCFKHFKMKPVALAVLGLGMVYMKEAQRG